MNTLISVGLDVLLIGAVLALFLWAINMLFPEPYRTWATVLLVVIAGCLLLSIAFGFHGIGHVGPVLVR